MLLLNQLTQGKPPIKCQIGWLCMCCLSAGLASWRAPIYRIFDQKHASSLQNKFHVSWLFQEAINAQMTKLPAISCRKTVFRLQVYFTSEVSFVVWSADQIATCEINFLQLMLRHQWLQTSHVHGCNNTSFLITFWCLCNSFRIHQE